MASTTTGRGMAADFKRHIHTVRVHFDRLPRADRERRMAYAEVSSDGKRISNIQRLPRIKPRDLHRLATGRVSRLGFGRL